MNDLSTAVEAVRLLNADQCETLYAELRDGLRIDYGNLYRMGREARYHAERGTRRADDMERAVEEATADYGRRAVLKSVLAVRTGRLAFFKVGDDRVTPDLFS